MSLSVLSSACDNLDRCFDIRFDIYSLTLTRSLIVIKISVQEKNGLIL